MATLIQRWRQTKILPVTMPWHRRARVRGEAARGGQVGSFERRRPDMARRALTATETTRAADVMAQAS